MSAVLPLRGPIRQLDGRAEPQDRVTEDVVQDPPRLAKILTSALADLAKLGRRWWPDHLDFEDRTVDASGTTKYRFEHRLGQRVRWWTVDWTGAAAPALTRDADTTDDVLVLTSTSAGTMTLRIEEAG